MAHVGYVCIGTNDFERACGFYDALLGEIGGTRLMPTPQGQMYRLGKGAMLMVTRPYDNQPATIGNGGMVALQVDGKDDVEKLHAKALAMGGRCEGPPGPRGPFGEFAYFRDLDGNKLCAYAPAPRG
jgi:catechol 2,3-dioxygenase-like lactoylglutathione lyase family enzyme